MGVQGPPYYAIWQGAWFLKSTTLKLVGCHNFFNKNHPKVCEPTTMKSLGPIEHFLCCGGNGVPDKATSATSATWLKRNCNFEKERKSGQKGENFRNLKYAWGVFNVVKTSKITKWSQLSWQSYNVQFTYKIQLNYKWITCIEKWLLYIITPNQHLNIVS
jgi:hypothetical protein